MHVLDTVRPSNNMPTATARTMRPVVQYSILQHIARAHRDVGGVLSACCATHMRDIHTLCYANDMSTAANQTMSLPRGEWTLRYAQTRVMRSLL